MVDFVPFPGMASTDNNTQYPANQIMITGLSGTVTASGSMVIVPATGNIGVGTNNPVAAFDVNVAANFRQGITIANGAVISGAVNISGNINVSVGTTSTVSGNIGIGTAVALGVSNVLAVYGSTNQYGNVVLKNTVGQSGVYFPDGSYLITAGGGGSYTNVNVASYLSGPVLVGNLYIGNNTVSSSTTTGALIMNGGAGISGNVNAGGTSHSFAGNVGIGTNNPIANLHISSSGPATLLIESLAPATTASSYGYLKSDSGANGRYFRSFFAYDPSNNVDWGIGNFNSTKTTLAFYTNGFTERMRITGNGNVLIGTVSFANAALSTATVVINSTYGGGIELVNNNSGGGNISAISTGGLAFGTFTGAVGSEIVTERARIDATGNVIIRGAVGIGTSTAAGISTTALSSNLYVWGNVIIANSATTSSSIIFPNGQTLSTGVFGPAGTIQVAGAGNSFTGDSSNFIWDNTNKRLGIGTATPAYQFSLYGTDYVLFNSRPGNSARQEITVGNVVSYGAVLGYDPSIPQSIGYLRRGDSAATSPAIAWSYVSSNYRVGINAVTQPQNAMEINGGLVIGNNYVGFAPQTTNANGASIQGAVGIGTFTPSANINNPLTVFAATGGGIELVSGGAAGGGNIVALTSGGLKFSNFTGAIGSESYTETMRIDANGNMGLGTSSPSSAAKLNISSSDAAYQIITSGTTNGIRFGTTSTYSFIEGVDKTGALSYQPLAMGGSILQYTTSGTERMRISNAGNVSMGTASSGGYLTLQRGGSASTAPDIATGDGTQSTYINSNWASGSYNPYVQAGDHGIIFHNGNSETGQFVISQWSSIAKGLRINTSGNVAMANNLTVTGEVYAYYSDSRLKDNIEPISNAINIINSISGVYYNANDLAVELLREDKTARKVGVLAQEIQAVMPEVVRQAPFDIAADGSSISGENYQTVQYDKLVPLLIQAVKEQSVKIAKLEKRIAVLERDS